jgi:hypothetical protein
MVSQQGAIFGRLGTDAKGHTREIDGLHAAPRPPSDQTAKPSGVWGPWILGRLRYENRAD